MKKNAAFSLVELLVVVAIVGILAGLMAAGFGGVRASAQEQQCRNNLKQLHDAVISYTLAHDKELPHAQGYDCVVFGGVEAPAAWIALVPNDKKPETYQWFLKLHGAGVTESPLAKFSDDLGCGWAARFGIEYGDLYPFLNDLAPYACPAMVAQVRKRAALAGGDSGDEFGDGETTLQPYRTYAMNAFFGCADSDFGLARPTYDHVYIDQVGSAGTKDVMKYPLQAGSKSPYHIAEPSRLLLFTEIVPAYANDVMLGRKGSGGVDNFLVQTVRAKNDSTKGYASDCCINPDTIDNAYERIGLDVNWDWETMKSGYSQSQAGFKYGVHPTGVRKPLADAGGKSVEVMGSLAVFLDGHIEKVFANTDGNEGKNGKNTAWFYNHGYEPSDKMPAGRSN